MRLRIVLASVTALAACQNAAPTGPSEAAPSVAQVQRATAAAAPSTRIIACRGSLAPAVPLYVVDGRIVSDSVGRHAILSAAAHVEVIKGAAATAVYGSRASAGVIVVATVPSTPPAR